MSDEERRARRYAQWEELGLDRVRADLLQGGRMLVGGPPETREMAWEWVRLKEAELAAKPKPAELLELKPGAFGFKFDLKEFWRRFDRWLRG